MLAAALEDEVAAYIAAHAGERDENGRRLAATGTPGRGRSRRPRARSRSGRRGRRRVELGHWRAARFAVRSSRRGRRKSRRSPRYCSLLTWWYGLSSKDFVRRWSMMGLAAGCPARRSPADRGVAGGVPALVRPGPLGARITSYCWADGLHFSAPRPSTLTGLHPGGRRGAAPMGRRSWSPSPTGTAQSTESWAGLLRDARRRACAPRRWRSGMGAAGGAAQVFLRCAAGSLLAAQGGQCAGLRNRPSPRPAGAGADPRRSVTAST